MIFWTLLWDSPLMESVSEFLVSLFCQACLPVLYFPPLLIALLPVLWVVTTLLGAWFFGSLLRPVWQPWGRASQGRRVVVLAGHPAPGGGSVALLLVSTRRGAPPELELQWTAASGAIRRFGTLIHEGLPVHLPRSEQPQHCEVDTAVPIEPAGKSAFEPDEVTLSIAAAGCADRLALACKGFLEQIRAALVVTSEPLAQRQRWLADRPVRLVVWDADLPLLEGRRFRSTSGIDYAIDCEGFLSYAATTRSVSLPGVEPFDRHARIAGRLGTLETEADAYRLAIPDDQPTPLGARELLVADLLQARDASGRAFQAVYAPVTPPGHRIGRNL